MVAKATSIDLWRRFVSAPVVALTGIYYQKEVAARITAAVAVSKWSTLSGMGKMSVWLGAVTSISMTTRFTMARCFFRASGLVDTATVSTPNT